jgi:hypothetical protein
MVYSMMEVDVSQPEAGDHQELQAITDRRAEVGAVREMEGLRLALRDPSSTSISTLPGTESIATTTIPAATAPFPSLVTTGPTRNTQAVPTITTTPTPIPGAQFTQTAIWYADLITFDTVASNHNLSPAAMENLRSEARAALLGENNDADMVFAKMQDRHAIWQGVVIRLEERIRKKLLEQGEQ